MNAAFGFILVLSTVGGEDTQLSHVQLPLHGTLHKGSLYGFFGKTDGFLDAVPISEPPKVRSKTYIDNWGIERVLSSNYRHHVGFDSLWITTGFSSVCRLKLDDLHLLDTSNKNALDQYLKKYPNLACLRSIPTRVELPTLAKKYDELETRRTGLFSGFPEAVISCGSVPISNNSCKCYLLTKPRRLEVWDTQFRWDEKKQRWETTKDGQNLETFDSPFAEEFYFFVRKQDYFFLTQSGKLYHAPPPKKGEKSRTMKSLWDDAKRPIVAVIKDADRDKVWLFAKDKNADAKLDLFFELKDTIRTESFDPAKLRPVNVEGRAKLLLQYVPLISPSDNK